MYDFRLDYIKELQQENASLRKKLKIANEETVKAQEIAKEVTRLYFKSVAGDLGIRDMNEWFKNFHK
jgi:hypothetical protein